MFWFRQAFQKQKGGPHPFDSRIGGITRQFQAPGCNPTDRVLKEGVPRFATLIKDLGAASIPYIDESGRYADFHALRYTFNTWLQTNGVTPIIAQELMRHSDRRLTDQAYLDSSLLPLQERQTGTKNGHTWIQISSKTGHIASRVRETGESGENAGTALIVGSIRLLTQTGENCKWRDRRDSNPRPPA